MTIVHALIAVFILGLVVWNLYREEKFTGQLTCLLVALPLLVRLLGLK